MKPTATTIDEYILQYPPEIQTRMNDLRAAIREAAPDAQEKISWGMATFVLHGNLVHFAGAKKHIGFHPAPSAIEAFQQELAPYHCSKGTVQFPYEKPLPLPLIDKMVRFRVAEQLELAKAKSKPKPLNQNSRQLKTQPTEKDPLQVIAAIPDEKKRADAITLLEIFAKVIGKPPVVWGEKFIGYGTCKYRCASGYRAEIYATGFSVTKRNITLHLYLEEPELQDYLKRLGKTTSGKSCVYINKLADIDIAVLTEMISKAAKYDNIP